MMKKNTIRLALTVLIIMAVLTSLVICTVDAKTGSASKSKGASALKSSGVGKVTGLGGIGSTADPSFSSFRLNVNPTAVGNSFVNANRGIADSFSLATDGFRVRNTNIVTPVDSTGIDVNAFRLNANPFAVGNAFVDARRGIADSFAVASDGFTFRSVDVSTPALVS
jgi:hypothetical protein